MKDATKQKIDINYEEFAKFLSLCSLKGELENKELLTEFEQESITARAVSLNKICCLRGTLTGVFADYGEVGLDDLSLLKSFMSTVKENMKLRKTDNKLMLEANKTRFSSVLRSPQYIVNKVEDAKFNPLIEKAKGNEFTLKSEDIRKIIAAVGSISSNDLIFTGEGKSLTLKLANQNTELEVDFDLATEVQPFTVKLAKVFVDLLSVIGEFDIIFSMKNDTPVYLTIKNKNMNFEYIFAIKNK